MALATVELAADPDALDRWYGAFAIRMLFGAWATHGDWITARQPPLSARLLRHEQYHMNMGCVLAAKGTAALAAGKKVTPGDLTKKDNTQSTSYDSKGQTDHNCNQTSQTAWEADIDAGLPKVTF